MTVHEFGEGNGDVIVLIHPSLVMWDYFEYVVPLMRDRYHLIVPALPGYDPDGASDFTGVEQIASSLADWLTARGLGSIACLYGCSMGGSIVARVLADGKVRVRSAVIDGGITPYQLPWLLTRCIAVKDFLLIALGKAGGLKLLEKAFSTDDYSEADLQYVAKVLKHTSARTIWRTFESCNNYAMPDPVATDCGHIEYWYAAAEAKARKADIAYIQSALPRTVFKSFENVGHGGLAVLKPELLASELVRVMREGV